MKLNVSFALLTALVIGVFMGALGMTILAPALPQIGSSFGLTPGAVVVAFSVYTTFYALSVPLMSKISDVRGYKVVYGASLVLFAISSAAAALAPTLPVLVLALVGQGIGGGGLFPIAQAIVGSAVHKNERGKILGILMGAFAVGAVLGPNVGGFLVQHLSWRWIYWINVPLCAIGFISLMQVSLPLAVRKGRIDWLGVLLVAVMFGSLVLGIEGFRHGGAGTTRVSVLFSLAALGLVALFFVERAHPDPILDFRLILSRSVAPLLAISFLIGYSLLGGVVFLPLFVQVRFDATSLGSGAVLNAAAVGMAFASWIAGAYTARTGGRVLVIIGMAAIAVAFAAMIVLQHMLWGILAGLVILGAGLGLNQGPLSYLSLALVEEKNHGQVSGLIAITRSLGGAFGITMAGVLYGRAAQGLSHTLSTGLGGIDTQGLGSSQSLSALKSAPPAVQEAVRQTLGAGVVHGWYVALGAALVGLIITFSVRRSPVEVE